MDQYWANRVRDIKDYVHSYLATPISKMPEVIWGGCKDYSDADDCWINTWKAIDEDGTIYPQACEFANEAASLLYQMYERYIK